MNRLNLIGLLFGMAFGGLLAGANLHEYDTIHSMLRLDEPDVFLLMASAIAVSAPALWWLEKEGIITPFGGKISLSRSKPEKHHIQGGALFGIGWAIAGTCPAPALVMLTSWFTKAEAPFEVVGMPPPSQVARWKSLCSSSSHLSALVPARSPERPDWSSTRTIPPRSPTR